MKRTLLPILTFAAFLAVSQSWAKITYTGKFFAAKKTSEIQIVKSESKALPETAEYTPETVWYSLLIAFQRDHKVSISPDKYQPIDILDLDGDGKDEIVVLSPKDELYVYTVDSRATMIGEISQVNLFITTRSFVDIYPLTYRNKTGLSDMLVYERARSMIGLGDGLKFIFQDIDGDGQVDMVVNASSAFVYLNKNGIFFQTAKLDRLDNPYFADLNNDGLKDIISRKNAFSVNICLSQPGGKFDVSQFPKVDNFFQALGVPDFRVFVAKLDRTSREPNLIFVTKPFIGDGDMIVHRYDKKNNTFIPFMTNKNIPFFIRFKDIDGDGVEEFYNRAGPANVYIDSYSAIKADFTPREADGLSYFIWDDLNNDNQMDFILVNAGGMFRGTVCYLRSGYTFTGQDVPRVMVEAPVQKTEEGTTNLVTYLPTNYSLMDLDGDGYRDLVTWNRNLLSVSRNTNGGFAFFFEALPGKPSEVFSDFNSDGKLDYYNTNSPGFGLWMNTGKTMERARLTPDPPVKKIVFFDADADGKKELFILGGGTLFSQMGVYVYKDKGQSVFEEIKGEFVALDHLGVQFMDVNGDGILDIMDEKDGTVLVNSAGK